MSEIIQRMEEGKAVMGEDERKNIMYKPGKRKYSTVRYTVNGPRRKEMLHRTTDLVKRCRQQGKHIVQFAQETKRKGLVLTSTVRSEGSKIKNTIIDDKEAVVPIEFIVPSLRIAIKNKLGEMESLKERLYNLNKLDER